MKKSKMGAFFLKFFGVFFLLVWMVNFTIPKANAGVPSFFASVTFDENDVEEGGEVTLKYESFIQAWNYAIGLSTSIDYRATVKLLEDVTAIDGSFGTGAGFNNGCILIPSGKYITLDLNGKVVNRDLTGYIDNGHIIEVLGDFVLDDSGTTGKITGGMSNTNGGGMYVNGTFTMNGGSIDSNSVSNTYGTESGGGIYLKNSIFTMNGGTISNNESISGGGIYGAFNSVLTMNEGVICNNTTEGVGGGVFSSGDFIMNGGRISENSAGTSSVYNSGVFKMTGGEISDNHSRFSSGGVYNSDTFTMSGGVICNNTVEDGKGGGLYSNNGINLSGSAEITGNINNGQVNNIYLKTGQVINISDNDETTENDTFIGTIGVTTVVLPTADTPIVITSNWGNSTGTIIPDNSAYASSKTSTEPIEKTISVPSISVTFDENGAEEGGVVTTNYASFVEAWNYAVVLSTSIDYRATVKLLDDVTAIDGSFGTGAGFENGSILIPNGKYITLNLNGKVVNRNLTEYINNGHVIKVSGNFVLDDSGTTGMITGGMSNTIGGGLYVHGKFTMKNGKIKGNKARAYGGGIGLMNGEFTLESGEISNNTASSDGGGIYTQSHSESVITMNGGSICNNSSGLNGGGILIQRTVTFQMNGGEITNNNTSMEGGGIYICNNSTVIVNGNVSIINNTLYNTLANNVYLSNGQVINISDNDETTENDTFVGTIGVTTAVIPTADTPIVITSNWGNSTGTIIPDNSAYVLSKTSTEPIEKTINVPSVSVTFDENGAEAGGVVTTNYASFVEAWNYAVGLSTSIDYRATVKLLDDVTAIDGSFGTGAGFENGFIKIPNGKYITLNLNGKVVNRNLAEYINNGHVIKVLGNFVLDDSGTTGKITGGMSNTSGGGVCINSGTFTMNGGSIFGNRISEATTGLGGGVCINSGTFTMNGGSISNNSSRNASGIFASHSGTFILNDGTISNNTAGGGNGGGVYSCFVFEMNGGIISDNTVGVNGSGGGVDINSGSFTMNDGIIRGNSASNYGGGVYINSGSFTMAGGEITENASVKNGAGLFSNVDIYLSGSAEITGNIKDGQVNNVYLSNGLVISISDNDETTENDTFNGTIGVTTAVLPTADTPIVVTSNWGNSTGTIIPDNSTYVLSKTSTEPIEKTISVPSISVTFDENGAEEGGVVTTNYASFVEAWNYAVVLSTTMEYRATVKLLDDVTAIDGSFGTGAGFENGSILIPNGKYITLDLNGKVVNRNLTEYINNGHVIKVSGNFVLDDSGTTGMITGGMSNTIGGGLYVHGKFTMKNGKIKGNKTSTFGGGVVLISGEFTLESGEISYNTASSEGGGIYTKNSSNSIFTMNGGSICNNSSSLSGGGILIQRTVTFQMNGGEITNNNTSMEGGGIYICNNSTVIVNGNVSIINNTLYNTLANNVYLSNGQVINISDNDETTENDTFVGTIGVTTAVIPTADTPIVITSNWGNSTGTIIPDNSAYVLSKTSTEPIEKTINVPSVSVTFDENGAEAGGVVTTNYVSFVEAWNYAVGLSTTMEYRATVKLLDDVTAIDGSFGTGAGFENGSISIPNGKYITLDLNGKVVNRNLAEYIDDGHVIKVLGNFVLDDSGTNGMITGGMSNTNGGGMYVNGTFTMNGGSIFGNRLSEATTGLGGGVFIERGIVTMNGGSISNNSSYAACGIYALHNSTFILNDGTISNNTAGGGNGGGVYSCFVFEMNGGIISDNTAGVSGSGGGVFINSGTFTMNDGIIRGNSASNYGGGVYNSCTFIMTGGTITENIVDGKGFGLYSTSDIYLSGSAVINGNINDGQSNNIYLNNGKVINISDNDETTENDTFDGTIGVTTAVLPTSDTPVAITSNWGSSTGRIFADKAMCSVVEINSEKVMVLATITYNSNFGDAIIKRQNFIKNEETQLYINDFSRVGYSFIGWNTQSNGEGTSFENSASVTFAEDTTLYAIWQEKMTVNIGTTPQAAVEYTSEKVEFLLTGINNNIGSFIVKYYVDENWTHSAPINVGSYNVKITREEDMTYKAYENEIVNGLIIIAKSINVTVKNSEKIYGEDNPSFSYSVPLLGDDTLSGTAIYQTTATKYSDVDSYDVTVSGVFNSNYSINFVAGTLTVKARDITVTAVAKTSVHNEDLVELTYTFSPEIYDIDNFTGTIATTANKEIVGEYDITQGDLSIDNYSITFVGAKYNVTAKAIISITQNPQSYDYDGVAKGFVIVGSQLTGFIVEYYINGSYTTAKPVNAGRYNVKVTRIEDISNYAFTVEINNGLVIKTEKVNKPMADTTTFIADGGSKTYNIPADNRYTVSGNVETAVGNYVVSVALKDKTNYEWVDGTTTNITFAFVIRQSQLVGIIPDDEENNDVIITIDEGFDPNYMVSITVVEQTKELNVSSHVDKKEEIVAAYDVRLLLNNVETQPDEAITVKILIPSECLDKNFRILHIHGENITEIPYVVEGEYAVITTNILSEFVFITDKTETSLVWLIIILSLLILAEIGFAIYKYQKSRQNKGIIKTCSFMPIVLSTFIPEWQIKTVIILSIVAGFGLLVNFYLHFAKGKMKKSSEICEEVFNEDERISFVESDELKTVNIQVQSSNTSNDLVFEEKVTNEITDDESEEETEVIQKIDEETGLAVLVRYRKSFMAKLIQSSNVTKAYYSELKNVLLSYKKTTSRISWNYDSINIGRIKLAKFNIRGKTLYFYLALNPDDFIDSKYKVEKSNSRKYEDTSCLYKISNDRRVKYAIELIVILANKYELQKGDNQEVDYYLPYETTDALIKKEFIKELISKEKYEDYLIRQQNIDIDSKKRSFISAKEVNELLKDEVANNLLETKQQEFYGKKVRGIINIDDISDNFVANDLVNLQTLKEKGLLPDKVNYYKVLARGILNKNLIIEANEFSIEAVKMIILTGGKAIKLYS